MISAARQFFERFQTLAGDQEKLAFLRGLISRQHEETEWLDFKGGLEGPGEESKPLRKNTIRKLWSENLSAFANTAGGVLILGIDARKNAEGIDVAQGERLVPEPIKLKQTLSDQLLTITDPPVPGVQIAAVADPDKDGHGFLVCLIPESQFKPHRATEKSLQRYFFRIGDSNSVPGTSLLRTMFFPQERSQIRMDLKPELAGFGKHRICVSAELHNEGPSSLEYPYLKFEIYADGLDRMSRFGTDQTHHSNWDHSGAGDSPDIGNYRGEVMLKSNLAVHPGENQYLFSMLFNCTNRESASVKLNAILYARNRSASCFRGTVSGVQIFDQHTVCVASTSPHDAQETQLDTTET